MKEKKFKRKRVKKSKIRVNSFYDMATTYLKHPINEDEIEAIDMTDTFFRELDTMHDEGELLNMNFNAPPGSGKSITAMAVGQRQMRKHYKKNFGLKDIDRDQQEYSKKVRDPRVIQTYRVIDEWNELEETGENSSIEKTLLNYMSDVMAQRGVHKLSCSPTHTGDKNAQIFLEVLPGGMDKINKINTCKLYYKVFTAGQEQLQLLGHVNISVANVINKKWYATYRKRKFEKMDLMLKEGIFQPRKLEYAEVTQAVIIKLKKLAKMSSILNPNIIRNYIKIEARQRKIPFSIVGEELAVRDVNGILDLWKSYHTLCKQIRSADKQISEIKRKAKSKEDLNHAKLIDSQAENLIETRDEIRQAIQIQEDELSRYVEISQKYNTIEEIKDAVKSK